ASTRFPRDISQNSTHVPSASTWSASHPQRTRAPSCCARRARTSPTATRRYWPTISAQSCNDWSTVHIVGSQLVLDKFSSGSSRQFVGEVDGTRRLEMRNAIAHV